MQTKKPTTIDEYIAAFEPEIAERMEIIRDILHKAAPKAVEAIKYQMPTLVLGKNLVHFAAYKNHIGIYPASSKDPKTLIELTPYLHGEATMRIKHAEKIPTKLITSIVKERVEHLKSGGN